MHEANSALSLKSGCTDIRSVILALSFQVFRVGLAEDLGPEITGSSILQTLTLEGVNTGFGINAEIRNQSGSIQLTAGSRCSRGLDLAAAPKA